MQFALDVIQEEFKCNVPKCFDDYTSILCCPALFLSIGISEKAGNFHREERY
jgi:hypothetical protein